MTSVGPEGSLGRCRGVEPVPRDPEPVVYWTNGATSDGMVLRPGAGGRRAGVEGFGEGSTECGTRDSGVCTLYRGQHGVAPLRLGSGTPVTSLVVT